MKCIALLTERLPTVGASIGNSLKVWNERIAYMILWYALALVCPIRNSDVLVTIQPPSSVKSTNYV